MLWKEKTLAKLNPKVVVGEAPRYHRDYDPWVLKSNPRAKTLLKDPGFQDNHSLKVLLGRVEACDRKWIYQQYDQRVGASTCLDCSSPIGAVVLPSGRCLATVLGCRPHLMRQDAWMGGMDSIFYPALELAAKGFEALAVTDCLNFGNPEKREVMSEFVASLGAMNQACEALNTPIISGNVSFYNESSGSDISPTPSTGLVGLRDSAENQIPSSFQNEGDQILLVSLGKSLSSGYFAELNGQDSLFYFEEELTVLAKKVRELRKIVNKENPSSSRVVGNFGLAYTLVRMGFEKNFGGDCHKQSKSLCRTTVSGGIHHGFRQSFGVARGDKKQIHDSGTHW